MLSQKGHLFVHQLPYMQPDDPDETGPERSPLFHIKPMKTFENLRKTYVQHISTYNNLHVTYENLCK